MADGTRISQLADSVTQLKGTQELQQKIIDELVQQLGVLAASYEQLSHNHIGSTVAYRPYRIYCGVSDTVANREDAAIG
ncbi:hypothetical protein ACLOJK_037432 [Asimina triloba]